MRYFNFLVIFLLTSTICLADINGEWVLDGDRTIHFNQKHSVAPSPWADLMKCTAENNRLIFRDGTFFSRSGSYECEFDDKFTRIEGHNIVHDFDVISDESSKLALRLKLESGDVDIVVLNFVNQDLFWVYDGGVAPEYDSHYRYYYRRAN